MFSHSEAEVVGTKNTEFPGAIGLITSEGIPTRRIIKSVRCKPNKTTQLVHLDSGPLSNASRAVVPSGRSECSISEETGLQKTEAPHNKHRCSCNTNGSFHEEEIETSLDRRNSFVSCNSNHSIASSVSDTTSCVSRISPSACSDQTTSFTAISESVPSCSLNSVTEVHNANFPGGRLRRLPLQDRRTSNSLGSFFSSTGINPFTGASLNNTAAHTASANEVPQSCPAQLNLQPNTHKRLHVQEKLPWMKTIPNGKKTSGIQSFSKISPQSHWTFSGIGPKPASNLLFPAAGDTEILPSSAAQGNAKNCASSTPQSESLSTKEKHDLRFTEEQKLHTSANDDLAGLVEVAEQPWRVQRAEKVERIGRGSYGDVYRGLDCDTGRVIAIKEILVPKDFTKDLEKQLQALEREIKVMRKLHHPCTINYLGSAREDNCLSIFMEYVPGGTVRELLQQNGPLSEDKARTYTQQLLCGLKYLHDRHVVHRDLKGDNMFLTEDGFIKVGDFGTSKELITTLVTDSVAGTPNFMAPEVIACSGHSYAADIWSLGCCVLEMLTGKPPFTSLDNHMAVMFAIMKGKLEDQVPQHISAEARDFIRMCTQHNPRDRWTIQMLQMHPWLVRNPMDFDAQSLQKAAFLRNPAPMSKVEGGAATSEASQKNHFGIPPLPESRCSNFSSAANTPIKSKSCILDATALVRPRNGGVNNLTHVKSPFAVASEDSEVNGTSGSDRSYQENTSQVVASVLRDVLPVSTRRFNSSDHAPPSAPLSVLRPPLQLHTKSANSLPLEDIVRVPSRVPHQASPTPARKKKRMMNVDSAAASCRVHLSSPKINKRHLEQHRSGHPKKSH